MPEIAKRMSTIRLPQLMRNAEAAPFDSRLHPSPPG
jgi:hypothetical protein